MLSDRLRSRVADHRGARKSYKRVSTFDDGTFEWSARCDTRPIRGFAIQVEQTRTEVVTSRETRRWIIPKGWPQKGKTPHRSAAREAFEEAGVVGTVGRRPIRSFAYRKRVKSGHVVACEVQVFPLKVKRQRKRWPERRQREVKWLSAKEAANTVREPKLAAIIRRLAMSRLD
jgi:8-oxo-dGTP pyrophosphatase MutT (NUDIX family)